MSISVPPPEFDFTGLFYNPTFWITSSTSLSQAVANTLYLRKTTTDSASALETFNAGIKSSSYDVTNPALIKYMFSSQTADTNLFENVGSSSTIKIGNQNTPQSIHVSYIDCRNNTINNATSPAVGNLIIGNSQTTGALTLGGSGRTTGAINIYRPLTPLYSAVPTSAEIGYNELFVSAGTHTTSGTANTATNALTMASCPIGTWLYEINFSISGLSVGRVLASLSDTSITPNVSQIVGGCSTTANMIVRLSTVFQTTTIKTLYCVVESSSVSVSLVSIYARRTRIA
jgi:hypothetical protein